MQNPAAPANASLPPASRFTESETEFHGRYKEHVWQSLFEAYRPWRGRMIATLLTGLVARTGLVGSATLVGLWIDSQCTGSSCRRLPSLVADWRAADYAAALVAMVCAALILNLIFRVAVARIGTRAAGQLHDAVALRVSRFPMNFFDRTPVGRALTRFSSDFESVLRMTGGPMGEFLSLSFDAVLSLVFIALTGSWGVPAALATGSSYACIYFWNRMDIRTARRKVSSARGPAIAHFAETTQGARTVKVYGRQALFTRRFNMLSGLLQTARLHQQRTNAQFSFQMSAATALSLIFIGGAGIRLQQSNAMSVGELVIILTQVWLLSTTLQQYFEYVVQFEEALTGAERLDDYKRRPVEPAGEPHSADAGMGIEVRDLCMRYFAGRPHVLKDVSFSLPAGKSLGIVGRTGSGKSSLVQALFSLYEIESGSVRICGLSVTDRQTDLSSLRGTLAYIPQEPTLFRGTLRDNLTLRKDADDSLATLLEQVGLAGLLMRDGGLDQVVHERGANFSSGQKQLICLVRAIVQNVPVIVMDEATSAIDPDSEWLLERALTQLLSHRTRVIVAHRLSTLEHCDFVLWLEEGQVRAFGPRQNVLPQYVLENSRTVNHSQAGSAAAAGTHIVS
jgi:ABC-type multidrug transport system fused ATPase/permease subunit